MVCRVGNCCNNSCGECAVFIDVEIDDDGICTKMEIPAPAPSPKPPDGLQRKAGWWDDCYDCDLWNCRAGCVERAQDGRHLCEQLSYKDFMCVLRGPNKRHGWPKSCPECHLFRDGWGCAGLEAGKYVCEDMDSEAHMKSQLPPGIDPDETLDVLADNNGSRNFVVDSHYTQNIDYKRIRLLPSQNKPFSEIKMTDEVTEGDEKVKFDVVVGNPPYQEGDGGAQKSAGPIYNLFVDCSKAIARQYISLIIPSRWFAGGKGRELDEFRSNMLNDIHIQELHDFLHPEEVFPDTNNRGGVCYFFRNKNYNNAVSNTRVVSHLGDNVTYTCIRPLKTRDLNIFLRNSKAIEILNQVFIDGIEYLSDYISAAKAFGFRTFFINDPKFRNSSVGLYAPIICYGRSGKIGYVEREEVKKHRDWIDKWKVFAAESNNIGTELNDDNQNSFVGSPMTICTETFLVVGADLDLNEKSATNLSNYLRTKFARFLLSLAKISQHGTSKTYRFVPIQDFSQPWTDTDLYRKYDLNDDQIAYIEATIKPME